MAESSSSYQVRVVLQGIQNAVSQLNTLAQTVSSSAQKINNTKATPTAANSVSTGANNAAAVVQKATADINTNLEGLARNFTNSTRLLGQGLGEIATTFSVLISAPLALLSKSAFTTASQFETQMARVRKTASLSEEQTKELAEQILKISKLRPTSQMEFATFAEQLGQLGVRGTNAMMRLMDVADQLKVATEIDSDNIVMSLGRIATAFGYDLNTESGVRTIEKLSNVLNKLENDTAATAGEIVDSLLSMSSVGGMLDIPVQKLAAIGATLISMGVDADAVGTRVSAFFTRIVSDADSFSNMMGGFKDKTGRYLYGTADAVREAMNADPVQVFTDAMDMLSQSESDNATTMATWFGFTGRVAGRVGVLGNNVNALSDNIESANEEFDNGSSLMAEYAVQAQTAESYIQLLKNYVSDIGIMLGNTFLPVIKDLVALAIPALQKLTAWFGSLNEKTKMLVMVIPLLVAVGIPLIGIFAQLLHGASLIGMSFVNLGKTVKSLVAVGKSMGTLFSVLGGGTTAVASGATAATGGIAALGGGLTGLLGLIAGVVGGIAAVAGVLKIMQAAGIQVGQFFIDLSNSAKAWGAKLMATYGEGLWTGALNVVAKVISKVASMIASFFEAHSPPEKGPLSTIDKWGKTLLNTYLKGFLNADFDILENVGRTIKNILDNVFAGNEDDSALNKTFAAVRENLSKLIDTFNKTGSVAEDVLNQVTDSLGNASEDVKKLIRLSLEYKAIQEKIAALEERKNQINKTYNSQIADIAGQNLTAEEKAAAMRQAMMSRDSDLRVTEQELDAQNELADAKKEELDWQQNFIDAQTEQIDLFKELVSQIKKLGDSLNSIDWDTVQGGFSFDQTDNSDEVQAWVDQINAFGDAIEEANKKWGYFMDGLNGKDFSASPYTWSDSAHGVVEDPNYAKYKGMYEMGEKLSSLKDTFEGLLDPMEGVDNAFTNLGKNEYIQTLAKALAGVFTAIGNALDLGGPFESMLTRMSVALSGLGIVLDKSGVGEKLKYFGETVGVAFVQAVGLLVSILGGLLQGAVELLTGLVATAAQLWATIASVFLDVVSGVQSFFGLVSSAIKYALSPSSEAKAAVIDSWRKLKSDVFSAILNFFVGAFLTFANAIVTVLDTIIGIISPIISTIGEIVGSALGKTGWGESVADWFGNIDSALNNGFNDLQSFLSDKKDSLTGAAELNTEDMAMAPTAEQFAGARSEWSSGLSDIASAIDNSAYWETVARLQEPVNTLLPGLGEEDKLAAIAQLTSYGEESNAALEQNMLVMQHLIDSGQTETYQMWVDYMARSKEVIGLGTADWVNTAGNAMSSLGAKLGQGVDSGAPEFLNKIKSVLDKAKKMFSSFSGSVNMTANGGLSGSASFSVPAFATGGITTGPTLGLIGEGSSDEAILPLDKLPKIMSEYFSLSDVATPGQNIEVNINNPVVRKDKDIDDLADEVVRRLEKKANNSRRLGSA